MTGGATVSRESEVGLHNSVPGAAVLALVNGSISNSARHFVKTLSRAEGAWRLDRPRENLEATVARQAAWRVRVWFRNS